MEKNIKGKNIVITIARSFGSGGKQTGIELSKKLGIPCYERRIHTMLEDYSGLNRRKFAQVDEKLRGSLFLKKLKGLPDVGYIISPESKKFTSDVNLYNIQVKLIQELAQKQSCIIVGKCANHILRDLDNVVSVYVEASAEACNKSIMNLLGVTDEEAKKLIHQTNKYRSEYHEYYTGENWSNPLGYDFTLNSDRVGRDKCADVIIEYLKLKFGNDIVENLK